MPNSVRYAAIVIGSSAGGLQALSGLLPMIPENCSIPIVVVQHRAKEERDLLESVLQHKCKIKVKQADEKEEIKAGFVYVAPANYHLMVERDKRFSLSTDRPVNCSRPSIDVLFETAAEVYKDELVGIILTGSNDDGANGIRSVFNFNGLTIAQDPHEAPFNAMPIAAIRTGAVRHTLLLKEIQQLIIQLSISGNYEESKKIHDAAG